MNVEELHKEIRSILTEGKITYTWESDVGMGSRANYARATRFTIRNESMYDAPEISLVELMELSKLFGTKSIDLDDFGYSGCDTCDYGSSYGHDIQIYNPVNHVDEIMLLPESEFSIDAYY